MIHIKFTPFVTIILAHTTNFLSDMLAIISLPNTFAEIIPRYFALFTKFRGFQRL